MNLNKRQKIIITSILVTLGLLSTQLVDFNLRFRFMIGLSIFAYFMSLWALWEGINLTKAVILLILPTLYSLAVASFYFLLPIRWLTRVPVATIFGLTFYLLLLAQNVFNVAAIRTIPLYRAASTSAFIATIFSAFSLFIVLRSFNMIFLINGLVVTLVSFLLTLPLLWTIRMEEKVSYEIIVQSFILSLAMGEIAMAFSFWPLPPPMYSSVLTAAFYTLLGLTTHYIQKRLSSSDVKWYLSITSVIWVAVFYLTSWTG